jgi:hypothetical protein
MRELVGQQIFGTAGPASYSDLIISDCTFHGCHLSNPGPDWNRIQQVQVTNCTQINCSFDQTLFEGVALNNLKRGGDAPLFMWGCVFDRVTLAGRISGLKINRPFNPKNGPELNAAWDRFARDHYKGVEWALDISKAKFPGGVTFEFIPGNKIRRNPETQILVTRQRLAEGDWRALDFEGTAIDLSLSSFEQESPFDSMVLAPRIEKWAKRDLAVLQRLRGAGIAESD